jgi:hypothetical protein
MPRKMNRRALQSPVFVLIVVVVNTLAASAVAQVANKAESRWLRLRSIELDSSSPFYVSLTHNTPGSIRSELLNQEVVRCVGLSRSLTAADLVGIQVRQERGETNCVDVWSTANNLEAGWKLFEGLQDYVRERQAGHTKEFLLFTLTNRTQAAAISDPDLHQLVLRNPSLPAALLTNTASSTQTNTAGLVDPQAGLPSNPTMIFLGRWSEYALVDGEVAWVFRITFSTDGSVSGIASLKCDAKEVDPHYRKVIAEVNREVEAEVNKATQQGTPSYRIDANGLKKRKLRARGIDWRSPADLDPDRGITTRY